MTAKADHLALGAAGEAAAAAFLARKGWRVLHRNWRPSGREKGLELDIVASYEGGLIFVEVKTRAVKRRTPGHVFAGIPVYAAFSAQKQKRLARAALLYLSAHNAWDTPCRFDLVCVEKTPEGQFFLEHNQHVIEIGHSVGCSDAPWQPW